MTDGGRREERGRRDGYKFEEKGNDQEEGEGKEGGREGREQWHIQDFLKRGSMQDTKYVRRGRDGR